MYNFFWNFRDPKRKLYLSPGPNARPVSYSFEKPDLLQKTTPSPAPYINNPIISSQQMNNDGTTNLQQGNLLRGIDKCLGVARSVVQVR